LYCPQALDDGNNNNDDDDNNNDVHIYIALDKKFSYAMLQAGEQVNYV